MNESRSSSLWRNRDYLLLWSGQAVSSVGTQVSQLAFPLLILALTGSPAQAGFAAALRALPYLIFSLPAGTLIDRWDRKRVMILCDAGRALSLASIPVAVALGQLTLLQLYVVSLLEGTLFVFFNLAEVACLPRVVSKEQLPAAAVQNMATINITLLLGPSLGGALFSIGRLVPFLADAVSYAISVLMLCFIQTPFQGERTGAAGQLWTETREGLVWLWKAPLLRFLAFLLCGFYFITSGMTLIIIVQAQQLHASPVLVGLLLGIGGIGGVIGTLLVPTVQKRFSFGQIIISAFWLMVLLWPLFAFARSLVVLGALTVLIFLVSPLYEVTQYTYRLALIPDALQGRVNSIYRLIAFAGQPLGLALTGVLLQAIHVVPTVLAFGCCFLLSGILLFLNPHVRSAGQQWRS